MLDYLGSLNPVISVFVTSFIPLLEVRASIPLGIVVHQLSPTLVLALAFIGSGLVPVLLLPFLDGLINWTKGLHDKLGEYAQIFFDAKYRQHSETVNRWGSLALIILVAIPLPLTGVWTATIVAYLFGIPYRNAMPAILAGALAASVLVTLATLGGLKLAGSV
ncbi:MAG: small multi-drug export protein [Patescibacteria group bacterium]